ncbi:isopentenyl phosphate kinase family protein [Candidatus Bathyarchaeota archaeon]|nr:isopentenyl phosphate kinase family protein [Candidatus Bathyarchaeota archaeon]
MSMNKLTILKIGGSVITDKDKELGARTDIISQIADEIYETGLKNLLIVHGGGSFGHPLAHKYTLKYGFKNEAQIIGFAETHHVMTVLNGLLMDALIWRGVPAISIAPSSCIITKNGRIQCFEETPLKHSLKMGFIPVLYGDTVFDTELGFTVLSGDQIVTYLALKLNAGKIVIGVDVDGLYDDDPKKNPKAKMFSHLTLKELKDVQSSIGGASALDVTGGMANKIAELIPALEKGIPVLIINAKKPKYIYRALKGKNVKGTLIEKE